MSGDSRRGCNSHPLQQKPSIENSSATSPPTIGSHDAEVFHLLLRMSSHHFLNYNFGYVSKPQSCFVREVQSIVYPFYLCLNSHSTGIVYFFYLCVNSFHFAIELICPFTSAFDELCRAEFHAVRIHGV